MGTYVTLLRSKRSQHNYGKIWIRLQFDGTTREDRR